MPISKVKAPDGSIIKVQHPEKATQEQIFRFAKERYGKNKTQNDEGLAQNRNADSVSSDANVGFLSSLNRGIAKGVGLPLDMLGTISQTTTGHTPEVLQGSENLMNMMEALNVPVQRSEPETFGQAFAQGSGEAAGVLPLLGGGTIKAAQGSGRIAQFADDALRTTAKNPAVATAAEISVGGSSGAGGQIAQGIAPDNPNARTYGELAGGLVNPVTAGTGAVRTATRAGKKTFAPFTEAGARPRAEDRIQGITGDIDRASQNLQEETIADLTPAQKTEDPRLLGLEKEVRGTDAQVDDQFEINELANRQLLRDEMGKLREGGDINAARDYVEGRVGKLRESIDSSISSAVEKARQRIDRLGARMDSGQSSMIVREELENALKQATEQENMLFEAVPNELISAENAKNVYREILQKTPKAQLDDIPEKAKRFLGTGQDSFGDVEKIQEMQGLRKTLLEQGRIFRSRQENNKARIADRLAAAIREDFETGAIDSLSADAAERMRQALDFSRGKNEKFSRGTVGRLLKTERAGGEVVDPELTLQQSVGRGGEAGNVAMRDIVAASESGEVRNAIDQFLRNDFATKAMRDGELNVTAAENYLRQNKAFLDNEPMLRDQIAGAIESQKIASSNAQRGERVLKGLTNRQKSAAARFLDSPIDQEFEQVLKARNPAEAARNLRQLVRGSKEATAGLRASAVDALMRRSQGGEVLKDGQRILSGRALLGELDNIRTGSAIREILPKESVDKLRQIGRELAKFEVKPTTPEGGIINDTPNRLLQTLAIVSAARAGGKFSKQSAGGSLQTAQIFSGRAREYLGKLTNDKARDLIVQATLPGNDDLMRALLTDMTTKKGRNEVAKRLNAWLIGPGSDLMQDGDENSPDEADDVIGPQSLKQGKSSDLMDKIMMAESSGDPNARARTSSASGLFQFTDGTFRSILDKYGKDTGYTMSDKNNPEVQRWAMKALMDENRRALSKTLGREPKDGELYLAHFAGIGDAKKMLEADRGREAALVLPKAAKANQSIFFNGAKPRSVGEVVSLLQKKVS